MLVRGTQTPRALMSVRSSLRGCSSDDDSVACGAGGLAAAIRSDAHRHVRAAAVEPRVFAAPALDSAGIRHELYAARTLHRALRSAGDAAQRPRRSQRQALWRE